MRGTRPIEHQQVFSRLKVAATHALFKSEVVLRLIDGVEVGSNVGARCTDRHCSLRGCLHLLSASCSRPPASTLTFIELLTEYGLNSIGEVVGLLADINSVVLRMLMKCRTFEHTSSAL